MTALPRHIPLQGASNFRDLGGYRGHGGKALRWRSVFRSDHLADLSAQDHAALQRLGLAHAVDFRGVGERAALSYDLPGVRQHLLSIEPTVIQRMQSILGAGQALTAQDTTALMQDTYRGFVHDNAPRFAALLQLLLAQEAPLVFHCTAGKDRTGFAAAVFLLALGVPRETVMQDYLLTNTLYRPPAILQSHAPQEALQVLWSVQENFLNAALDMVDAQYGSVQTYLREVLGLDAAAQAALAQRFLQAA